MAHNVVDRGAQVPGVGRVAWWLVADGGRARALLGHAFGAEAVDFEGGDTGLDVGGDVVQHFRSKAAGLAHAFYVFGGFGSDAHAENYPTRLRDVQGMG